MTSFQIGIAPNKKAAGRFILKVRRALQKALIEETDVNQSKIADAIGVHRSVISRELNGRQDITLGRVAELAWAMGREIEFELKKPMHSFGDNTPIVTTSWSSDMYTVRRERHTTTSQSYLSNAERPDAVLEVL